VRSEYPDSWGYVIKIMSFDLSGLKRRVMEYWRNNGSYVRGILCVSLGLGFLG